MTAAFRRGHLLVAGQTEEVVADAIIRPHLERIGWVATTSLVATERPAGRPAHKGEMRCLAEAVGDSRFRPNLVVHELEAWVFAAADESGPRRLAARAGGVTSRAGGVTGCRSHR